MENQPPVFNPLDKKNLAISVADALMCQPELYLPRQPFNGAGIYALYYHGEFPLYHKAVEAGAPIFIGKAMPPGPLLEVLDGTAAPHPTLFNCLTEHAEALKAAENLDFEDFSCRYLVTDAIWIPLAEAVLLKRFQPLWNHQIPGFAHRDPRGNYSQYSRSHWDTLHPGRSWANRLSGEAPSPKELYRQLQKELGTDE
jgi:hypothetical protein